MYQTQLVNLLREFTLVSNQHINFNKLVNDADYRNHCLQSATFQAEPKLNQLISQIKCFEDLLSHQLKVDVPNQSKTKDLSAQQRRRKATLALSCMLFIAASIAVVEEVKYQRGKEMVALSTQAD